MAQSSRIFRIFVSSIFSDLEAELNTLQKKAFPHHHGREMSFSMQIVPTKR